MNRDQIIAKWNGMTPRERDAWVGEVVTKITPEYDAQFRLDGWRLGNRSWTSSHPRYTTDISAAWVVLEVPDETGITPIWGVMPTADGYNVAIDYGRDTIQAETAPEAICLAAIIAKLYLAV